MRAPHARHIAALAAALLAASTAGAQAPLGATRSPATRAAVAAVFPARDVDALVSLAGSVDARWNARDAAGIAALYTIDASVRGLAPAALAGRDAIRERFTTTFAALAPELRHRTEIESLQPVSDDVVISEGRAYIERALPDGSREVVKTFDVTSVAVRRGAAWRLVHVHSRVVAAEKPAAGN